MDDKPQGTTTEKGDRLEKAFCAYMKKRLGYTKALRGQKMPSRYNSAGIKLDIMGVKETNRVRIMTRITKVAMISVVPSLALFYLLIPFSYAVFSIILLSEGFILFVIVYFIFRAKKRTNIYGWVECKFWKRKVTFKDVDKMLSEFKGHKKSKKSRNFRHKYFVAANGFYNNALEHAQNNGIICYICIGERFEFRLIEPE